MLAETSVVLSGVRKAKSEAKVGMRTEVRSAEIAGPTTSLAKVRAAQGDLVAAGRIAKLIEIDDAGHLRVEKVDLLLPT